MPTITPTMSELVEKYVNNVFNSLGGKEALDKFSPIEKVKTLSAGTQIYLKFKSPEGNKKVGLKIKPVLSGAGSNVTVQSYEITYYHTYLWGGNEIMGESLTKVNTLNELRNNIEETTELKFPKALEYSNILANVKTRLTASEDSEKIILVKVNGENQASIYFEGEDWILKTTKGRIDRFEKLKEAKDEARKTFPRCNFTSTIKNK